MHCTIQTEYWTNFLSWYVFIIMCLDCSQTFFQATSIFVYSGETDRRSTYLTNMYYVCRRNIRRSQSLHILRITGQYGRCKKIRVCFLHKYVRGTGLVCSSILILRDVLLCSTVSNLYNVYNVQVSQISSKNLGQQNVYHIPNGNTQ